jgi:hypothetical protein
VTHRFRVELIGDAAILQAVARHLQAPEIELMKDGDTMYLVSSTFDAMGSRDDVFEAAVRMERYLEAAIRLVGLKAAEPLVVRRVDEETPVGRRSTTYLRPPSAVMTLSVPPPTILIDGMPPPLPPALPIELAMHAPRVARVLELMAKPPTWQSLYKVLDVIKDDLGGPVPSTWASGAELRRFKRTANSHAAVGLDQSRHAKDAWQAPRSPMTLREAIDLFRLLVTTWLASK